MYVQGQGEESFKKWRMEKIIGSEVRWFDIYFPLLKEGKDILEEEEGKRMWRHFF